MDLSRFRNRIGGLRSRSSAGHELALRLDRYRDRGDVVVVALPPGGVPVAFEIAQALGAPLEVLDRVVSAPVELASKTVILVDEGLASDGVMRAAVEAIYAQGPSRIVVAVPVGTLLACARVRPAIDELICLITHDYAYAVSPFYESFDPVSDEQIADLLSAARRSRAAASARGAVAHGVTSAAS